MFDLEKEEEIDRNEVKSMLLKPDYLYHNNYSYQCLKYCQEDQKKNLKLYSYP
jgi:hypothetical protein